MSDDLRERDHFARRYDEMCGALGRSEQPIAISSEIFDHGFWRSCSGCHETDEGYPTGPYSAVFRCHLGSGCHECGGLGAIWEQVVIAAEGGLDE